jgi:hypothetical protein
MHGSIKGLVIVAKELGRAITEVCTEIYHCHSADVPLQACVGEADGERVEEAGTVAADGAASSTSIGSRFSIVRG